MESKQDVFNELWRLAAENRRMTGHELIGLQKRYAAAGKVPIPREVGEWLNSVHGVRDYGLDSAFVECTIIIGEWPIATRFKHEAPTDDVATWILFNPFRTAEAWNHGWYAEEDAK